MIINTNVITLSDSGLTLDGSVVAVHTSTISNNNYTAVKVRAQTGFFLNPEKMLESPANALRVEGYKDNNVLIFDYPTDDTNVFYFFDLQLKAHLIKCFPQWDADLLVITTEPVV